MVIISNLIILILLVLLGRYSLRPLDSADLANLRVLSKWNVGKVKGRKIV
jgi:hypothetical protein